MTKTAIWDSLGKTDPAHTKPFNRSGGFKGTALKPIWIMKRLTEQFGAAGEGWGVNEPSFQVVPADGEILVYCTVSAWHGTRDNLLWGVGGDKVQAKRQSGSFCDDEAFKKAFTDAINNAFKSLGVGADIHMGMFEDDKYVTATKAEFAEAEKASKPAPDPNAKISERQREWLIAQAEASVGVAELCRHYGKTSLKDFTVGELEPARDWLKSPTEKAA
jgi:hypothetical protein